MVFFFVDFFSSSSSFSSFDLFIYDIYTDKDKDLFIVFGLPPISCVYMMCLFRNKGKGTEEKISMILVSDELL